MYQTICVYIHIYGCVCVRKNTKVNTIKWDYNQNGVISSKIEIIFVSWNIATDYDIKWKAANRICGSDLEIGKIYRSRSEYSTA